jgi:hypothetical protein
LRDATDAEINDRAWFVAKPEWRNRVSQAFCSLLLTCHYRHSVPLDFIDRQRKLSDYMIRFAERPIGTQ